MSSEAVVERYERMFTVEGLPVPAVRMTQRSKHRNRQAQRYLAYKEAVGWAHQQAYGDAPPFTGPVVMDVMVRLLEPSKRRWDVSNVLKAIEDGLNGVAYLDDKQIVKATIHVEQSAWETDFVNVYLEGEYEQEPR